ncbi:MAG TPA: Rid family hydrolase [Dermatophilaceae bacterium]|nr:Rid family hydrolase [Dermatophilaceae bacterium]HPZ67419.1 Rid family hydrolase [Dermatophilaceae bacterium]
MQKITLLQPDALVHSPAFSHVAVVPPGAVWVLVGGQNGVDVTGRIVEPGDPAAQARRALANVESALHAAGSVLSDVVAFSVTLTEEVDIRAAYGAIAPTLATAFDRPPLVSVAVVSSLAVPGALVEVAVTAARLS